MLLTIRKRQRDREKGEIERTTKVEKEKRARERTRNTQVYRSAAVVMKQIRNFRRKTSKKNYINRLWDKERKSKRAKGKNNKQITREKAEE